LLKFTKFEKNPIIASRQEQDWEVDYLVILERDAKTLVAARNGDSCDLLFLVDEHTGDVYARQPDGSWDHIFGSDSRSVIAHMVAARNQNIPIFQVNSH